MERSNMSIEVVKIKNVRQREPSLVLIYRKPCFEHASTENVDSDENDSRKLSFVSSSMSALMSSEIIVSESGIIHGVNADERDGAVPPISQDSNALDPLEFLRSVTDVVIEEEIQNALLETKNMKQYSESPTISNITFKEVKSKATQTDIVAIVDSSMESIMEKRMSTRRVARTLPRVEPIQEIQQEQTGAMRQSVKYKLRELINGVKEFFTGIPNFTEALRISVNVLHELINQVEPFLEPIGGWAGLLAVIMLIAFAYITYVLFLDPNQEIYFFEPKPPKFAFYWFK